MRGAFAVFDVPAVFDLDLSELDARYRALQRTLHPDRIANQVPHQRASLEQQGLEATEAYRVLRDPVLRAQALLVEMNVPPVEQLSPAFLMDVLEEREAFEEQRTNLESVESALQACQMRLATLLQSIAAAFAESPPSRAATLVAELKYLVRFRDEIRDALERLEQ